MRREGEAIWVDGNGNNGSRKQALYSLVTGDVIYGTNDNGIDVSNGDGAPLMDATVTNDTINISRQPGYICQCVRFWRKNGVAIVILCAAPGHRAITRQMQGSGSGFTDVVQPGNNGDSEHV